MGSGWTVKNSQQSPSRKAGAINSTRCGELLDKDRATDTLEGSLSDPWCLILCILLMVLKVVSISVYYVRRLSTGGQSACDPNGPKGIASETQRGAPPSCWFCQWLVGVVDGAGTFSIVKQNGKWSLAFQISQSSYNLRLLYFIKKMVGVGNVNVDKKRGMACGRPTLWVRPQLFRIRDLKILSLLIFPIFDRFPLLTTQQFYYDRFKKAHSILVDPLLSKKEKDQRLEALLLTKPDENYVSPAWDGVALPMSAEDANRVVTDGWLIGFTEAEGSFYLVVKEKGVRIVHGFGISQKLDWIVLEAIRIRLGIATKVVRRAAGCGLTQRVGRPQEPYPYQDRKHGHNQLDTTNSRAIANIGSFFNGQMKGMKAVEFKIWLRSQRHKGDFSELERVQSLLRKLRRVRASQSLWDSADSKKDG